jgi:predicted HicB family RNase H-like nuclease
MKEPTPTISRSWVVPYELYSRLMEHAKKEGKSINSVVVQAIRQFLEGLEEKK